MFNLFLNLKVLPPLARIPLPEFERKPPVHVDPVDLRPPQEIPPGKLSPELIAERSKRVFFCRSLYRIQTVSVILILL